MQELANVKEIAKPDEILLVVDSLTGQDIVNVAASFNEKLSITGAVLTKLDGDSRGGGALSIRHITNVPIKFIGTGEKLDAIDLDVYKRQELTNYSLVEQMNRVISTQENQAMEKNIEIVFEMPKKEIFIEGDEQRLEQVWTNIISNAIKYTNEGGLITITMKKNSKDIEISIEDTGIGMSKEVVSHIFERFYREDKARNVEGLSLIHI